MVQTGQIEQPPDQAEKKEKQTDKIVTEFEQGEQLLKAEKEAKQTDISVGKMFPGKEQQQLLKLDGKEMKKQMHRKGTGVFRNRDKDEFASNYPEADKLIRLVDFDDGDNYYRRQAPYKYESSDKSIGLSTHIHQNDKETGKWSDVEDQQRLFQMLEQYDYKDTGWKIGPLDGGGYYSDMQTLKRDEVLEQLLSKLCDLVVLTGPDSRLYTGGILNKNLGQIFAEFLRQYLTVEKDAYNLKHVSDLQEEHEKEHKHMSDVQERDLCHFNSEAVENNTREEGETESEKIPQLGGLGNNVKNHEEDTMEQYLQFRKNSSLALSSQLQSSHYQRGQAHSISLMNMLSLSSENIFFNSRQDDRRDDPAVEMLVVQHGQQRSLIVSRKSGRQPPTTETTRLLMECQPDFKTDKKWADSQKGSRRNQLIVSRNSRLDRGNDSFGHSRREAKLEPKGVDDFAINGIDNNHSGSKKSKSFEDVAPDGARFGDHHPDRYRAPLAAAPLPDPHLKLAVADLGIHGDRWSSDQQHIPSSGIEDSDSAEEEDEEEAEEGSEEEDVEDLDCEEDYEEEAHGSDEEESCRTNSLSSSTQDGAEDSDPGHRLGELSSSSSATEGSAAAVKVSSDTRPHGAEPTQQEDKSAEVEAVAAAVTQTERSLRQDHNRGVDLSCGSGRGEMEEEEEGDSSQPGMTGMDEGASEGPASHPDILPDSMTTGTTTTTSTPHSFSIPVQVSSSPGNSELCFAEAEDCYTEEAYGDLSGRCCEEQHSTIPLCQPHTPTTSTAVQETREEVRSRQHTSVIAQEQGRYFRVVAQDQHAEEVYVMTVQHHQAQQSSQHHQVQSPVCVGASVVHGDGASVSPSGHVWSATRPDASLQPEWGSERSRSGHSQSGSPSPGPLHQLCPGAEDGPWSYPESSSLPPHMVPGTSLPHPEQPYAGYRGSPSPLQSFSHHMMPGTQAQHQSHAGYRGSPSPVQSLSHCTMPGTQAQHQSHVDPGPSLSPPVQLPAITVHAAGSLPPWVPSSPTTRLDLRRATNSGYAELRRRRATFGDDWLGNSNGHEHSGINAANMALSGFYIFDTAHRHRVRCFYCGLQLDYLTSAHNIWDEHVRHSPHCAYLNAVMGSDFVQQTLRNLRDDLDPCDGDHEQDQGHV